MFWRQSVNALLSLTLIAVIAVWFGTHIVIAAHEYDPHQIADLDRIEDAELRAEAYRIFLE